MPPELGNVATGDCDTLPARLTYVPNALPVTLCACTAPARRVSATRNLRVMVVLLESSVIARVEPAQTAEPTAPRITRRLVGRGREERHLAVEREAAPEFVRVVLVPLDVAAAVGRRA